MQESINILKRIREIITTLGVSETTFAKQLGVPQATVNNMFIRESDPKSTLLSSIIEKYAISATWLLTGKGSMYRDSEPLIAAESEAKYSDRSLATTRIPVLAQKASAGPGQEWLEDDEIVEYMNVEDLLPELKYSKPGAFRVSGISMTGAGIEDNDIVVFDTRPCIDKSDGFYVLAIDGSVYVKLCEFDNPAKKVYVYSVRKPKELDLLNVFCEHDEKAEERFKVFGRVIALVRENKFIRW